MVKGRIRIGKVHYRRSHEDLHMVLLLFFLVYFVGIFIFHIIEGWTFLDSAYFVTATITTIGYGDFVPVTSLGKLLTIFFAWIGVSTGFFLIFKISEWRKTHIDELLRKGLKK